MIPIDAFKHRLAVAALSAALFAGVAFAGNGYLGVQVSDADNGARILSVRDATPAADAGLQADDVVLAVDGTEIKNSDEMITALGTRQAGEQIKLKVKRGTDSLEKTITLRTRPDEVVAPTPAAKSAAKPKAAAAPAAEATVEIVEPPQETASTTQSAAPSTPAPDAAMPAMPTEDNAPRKGGFLGVTLDTEGGPGNVILDVRPEGPASKAELRAGDKITSIAGKAVTDGESISQILSDIAPGQSVEVAIERTGKKKLRTVKLAKYGDIAFEGAMQIEPGVLHVTPAPAAPAASPEPPAPAEPAARSATNDNRGWLGVYLTETDTGAAVESTVDDSPARKAGLKDGDKIVVFGDRVVNGPDDIMSAMSGTKPGQKVDVIVERAGKKEHLTVKLGKRPTDQAVAVAPSKAIPEPSDEMKAKVEKELEKARGEAEKARARADKLVVEQRAKADEEIAKARKLVEKTKKEVQATAQKAKKEAREQATKVREEANTARAEGMKKSAKKLASAISGWFFPEGESAEIRVEKKDDGFWVTTGSGANGILVPQDGETTLTLKGGVGGVQIVPPSANASVGMGDAHAGGLAFHGGGDGDDAKIVAGNPLVIHKMNDGQHEVTVTSKGEGGTWVVKPDGKNEEFEIKLDGMDFETNGIFTIHGDANEVVKFEAKGKHDGKSAPKKIEKRATIVENVKPDGLHILPHPPVAAGGGIVINNNGGTVIIGDSIARDFLHGHGMGGHDVLIDKTVNKDDKKQKLMELGYIAGEKSEKKAEKKKAKKDDS